MTSILMISTIMPLYQCRLCLKKTLTKINVLEENFSKMIEILTSIKVSENDGLPKYSCTKCAQDVKIALITKKRIIKSHMALIEHLKRKKVRIREQSTFNNIKNDEQQLPVVEHSYEDDSENESEQHSIQGTIEFVNVDSTTKLETVKSIDNEDEQGSEQNDAGIKNVADVSIQNVANGINEVNNAAKSQKNDISHFVCQQCNLTFNFKKEYQAHKKKHIKTKCPICKSFIRSDNFKKHLLMHDAPPANCDICGATCKNVDTLRSHIYRYHKLKADTYVCEECGKNFRTNAKFLLHKRKQHTGLRPFKCETCGKAFFTNANLKQHDKMTHKKLRPYPCEFCTSTFSSPYALKTHKRQHTNEKPYICEFCNEGFKQKVSMRTHMKSKHGYVEPNESVCEQCGKGFASAFALKIHERLHLTTEKCDLCSDSFTGEIYLKNHLKQVHGIKTENVEVEEDTLEGVD